MTRNFKLVLVEDAAEEPAAESVLFEGYAAFLAASLPAGQSSASANVRGTVISWYRDPAGLVGPTADGGMWSPMGVATPQHFGALGDWNGTTGTDDTAAINAAFSWLAAADSRSLTFPEGWYLYSGSVEVDLGAHIYQSIQMQGRVWMAATTGTAWTFHNARYFTLAARIEGGGAVGNFSNRTPVGGSTGIKLHRIQRGWIDVQSWGYAGRVLHATAEATDATARCISLEIKVTTWPRYGAGYPETGQPFYCDTNACTQTGAFGKVEWRGEGAVHGPVFERLNDLIIPYIEAGRLLESPLTFRGVRVAKIQSLYIGETDGTNAQNNVRFVSTSGGTRCDDIQIGMFRGLRAGLANLYASGFEPDGNGLTIASCNVGSSSDYAVHLEDMSCAVRILSLVGKTVLGLLRVTGACGDVFIGDATATSGITGTPVKIEGTVSRLSLNGVLTACGGAGHSLVDLGANNNNICLDELRLDSSTASQMIAIGFAGANKIRMVGGVIGGTSPLFTSGRRPEYIRGVRGYQTEGCGDAVIAAGSTSVTVQHGLKVTPQVVNASGFHAETAAIFVPSITSTQITFQVASAVSANRTIYWRADGVLLRNDADA